MKTCTTCKTKKPLTEFHKDRQKKDGHQGICKPCKITSVRKWQKDNPERYQATQDKRTKERKQLLQGWVAGVKLEQGCSNCDENCPDCLDFHHVNDDKEKSVAHLVFSNSLAKLINEINKCCILCSNCHRKHHAGHRVELGDTLSVTKEDFDVYCKHNQAETQTS